MYAKNIQSVLLDEVTSALVVTILSTVIFFIPSLSLSN